MTKCEVIAKLEDSMINIFDYLSNTNDNSENIKLKVKSLIIFPTDYKIDDEVIEYASRTKINR